MPLTPFTQLNGVSDVLNQSLPSDQIESNLITFFNWGLLNAGGFGNVVAGTVTGVYGGDMSALRPVADPNYQAGQVWEGFRQDWVWESGINYPIQPIQVSGVWVNGTFHPINTTGAYSHYVSYPLGRIVFNNPLPTNSVVQASYSYRLYSFLSSDAQWFREVMFNSFKVDDQQFMQYGSGVWNVLAENRVQLPAVVVEVTPRTTIFGYELGGTTRTQKEIRFHVYTETSFDRKKLVDIITMQKDKTIPLFDKNLVAQNNNFPLDVNGSIASGCMCYPDLARPTGQGGYFWKPGTFLNMSALETISTPPFYQATVINTFEVLMLIQ